MLECTAKCRYSTVGIYQEHRPSGYVGVDVNKGDSVHPEYRSRLVAQEINTGKREDLFAATPPLEAKKILMLMAVTEGIGYKRGRREQGMKLDFIDVRRAYFHAKSNRLTYDQLPPEDVLPGEEDMCGRLKYSMYVGTYTPKKF